MVDWGWDMEDWDWDTEDWGWDWDMVDWGWDMVDWDTEDWGCSSKRDFFFILFIMVANMTFIPSVSDSFAVGREPFRSTWGGDVATHMSAVETAFLKRDLSARRCPVPRSFCPVPRSFCFSMYLDLPWLKGSSRRGRFGSGEQMVYQEASPFRETVSLSITLSNTWGGGGVCYVGVLCGVLTYVTLMYVGIKVLIQHLYWCFDVMIS